MKAHPNALSKICHQVNLVLSVTGTGCVRPLIVGNGAPVDVDSVTRSEKHMPKPCITSVDPMHAAGTHVPPRKTCSELHDKH